MINENKYDIMENELDKIDLYTNYLLMQIKLLNIGKTFKIVNDEQICSKKKKLMEESLPFVEMLNHIGYENSIDITKIPKEKLEVYLRNEGISIKKVMNNYNQNISNYAKNILIYSLLKYSKEKYPEMNAKYIDIKEKGIYCIFPEGEIDEKLNSLIDKLSEKNFKLDNLNNEEKGILEKYHNKYMLDYIYSQVNEKNYAEDEVTSLIKRLY